MALHYTWGDDSGAFDLPDLPDALVEAGAMWANLDTFDERGAWLARLVVEGGYLGEIAFVGIQPDERSGGQGYVCLVQLTESGYQFPIRGWRQLVLMVKEIGRRAERRRLPGIIREVLAEEAGEAAASDPEAEAEADTQPADITEWPTMVLWGNRKQERGA